MALAGALAVDELFAGAVLTVMLASGRLLEVRAAARARRGLLLERSPRTALRRVASGVAEDSGGGCRAGDRLVVSTGGLLPSMAGS
jgi:cation transport ATPase